MWRRRTRCIWSRGLVKLENMAGGRQDGTEWDAGLVGPKKAWKDSQSLRLKESLFDVAPVALVSSMTCLEEARLEWAEGQNTSLSSWTHKDYGRGVVAPVP